MNCVPGTVYGVIHKDYYAFSERCQWEEWASLMDRLEMYFVANSIKDELKLPTLIALMGDAEKRAIG